MTYPVPGKNLKKDKKRKIRNAVFLKYKIKRQRRFRIFKGINIKTGRKLKKKQKL
jgi:hypothetical protein